jgi:hypothetical protein
MAKRMDIKIEVADNDIQYGDSDEQHVQDTINAAPGWWKEHPQDGVNIRAYLNSDGQQQKLARDMMVQLRSDGYTVTNPVVSFDASGKCGKLIIQPNATI